MEIEMARADLTHPRGIWAVQAVAKPLEASAHHGIFAQMMASL